MLRCHSACLPCNCNTCTRTADVEDDDDDDDDARDDNDDDDNDDDDNDDNDDDDNDDDNDDDDGVVVGIFVAAVTTLASLTCKCSAPRLTVTVCFVASARRRIVQFTRRCNAATAAGSRCCPARATHSVSTSDGTGNSSW
jgi:hypothetical protein